MQLLRLATWNVAHRTKRAPEQAAVLRAAELDVVVLTEVTRAHFSALVPLLAQAGFEHAAVSLRPDAELRSYGVAIAARASLELVDHGAPTCRPERLLRARLVDHAIDIMGVYVPTGAREPDRKSEMLEAVAHALEQRDAPQLLCGDMNAPRAELADGGVVTFGQRLSRAGAPLAPSNDQRRRLDAAERRVLRGTHGLQDAFRACHPDAEAFSWFTKPKAQGRGYRLDHMLVSQTFAVLGCAYDTSVIERGLSDHALLVADLRPSSRSL